MNPPPTSTSQPPSMTMSDMLLSGWNAIYEAHWGQGPWEGLDRPRSPKEQWTSPTKVIPNVNVQPLTASGNALFVFDQYPYLLGRILALLDDPALEDKAAEDVPQVVLTGTSGIGKSAFAIFLLIHLLRLGEPVLYYRSGCYYVFSKSGVRVSRGFPYETDDLIPNRLKFILDTDQGDPPPSYLLQPYVFCIIHVTSTDSRKYSWVKQHDHCILVMNPHPEEELTECVEQLTRLSGQKFPKTKIASAVDSFGPNIRIIRRALREGFKTHRETISTEVKQLVNASALTCLLSGGEQNIVDDVIKTQSTDPSPEPADRAYKMSDRMQNLIANKTVWKALVVHHRLLHRPAFLETMRDLSLQPGSKASAGWVFESLAHDILLEGGKYKVKRLTKKDRMSGSESESYEVPPGAESHNLFGRKWKLKPLTAKLFTPSDATSDEGIYYIPAANDNPTFDAFTLRGNRAVAFHITLARTHSLKSAGLDRLRERFRGHRDRNLVFVVPAGHGAGFSFEHGTHGLAAELEYWLMEIDLGSSVVQPLLQNWGEAERVEKEEDDDDEMVVDGVL